MKTSERVTKLHKLLKDPLPGDKELLRRAFEFADKAHLESPERDSKTSWDDHTYNVAESLASWGQNATVVTAGILHNAINAGAATEIEIRGTFGKEVLTLIQGVHNLGMLKYRGLEKHLEALRKLFVATAKDVRIILIAFANRLDNLKTLGNYSEEHQFKIAQETLEVHARIAHRLGMGQLKAEFETLSFPYVDKEAFDNAQKLIESRSKESKKELSKIHRRTQTLLAKNNIRVLKSDYRVKNPYSLHNKILRYKAADKQPEEIADVFALRIIVPDEEKCYRTLGIINNHWRPVSGGIKDYIATPKPNGYRSLHTAILVGDGHVAEIQIRTPEMHEEAEFGIASHISYKEAGSPKMSSRSMARRLAWVKSLLKWQEDNSQGTEFAHELRTDFLQNRIFVFTPKGEVVELPEGATAIDFAYAIHSRIGDTAVAAVINSNYRSLDTKLMGRDTVKIETKEGAHPSHKWLLFATTAEARRKIRTALKKVSSSI